MTSTKILGHKVDWNYDDEKIIELPESEEEYIKEGIELGVSSGELNYIDDKEQQVRGYWEIDYICHYCGERDTKEVY